jgi:hypothetical protein
MIRVVVTGPGDAHNRVPYIVRDLPDRVEVLQGMALNPLLDACARLKRMSIDQSLEVGLFDLDRHVREPSMKTTIGFGASIKGETPAKPEE